MGFIYKSAILTGLNMFSTLYVLFHCCNEHCQKNPTLDTFLKKHQNNIIHLYI